MKAIVTVRRMKYALREGASAPKDTKGINRDTVFINVSTVRNVLKRNKIKMLIRKRSLLCVLDPK